MSFDSYADLFKWPLNSFGNKKNPDSASIMLALPANRPKYIMNVLKYNVNKYVLKHTMTTYWLSVYILLVYKNV